MWHVYNHILTFTKLATYSVVKLLSPISAILGVYIPLYPLACAPECCLDKIWKYTVNGRVLIGNNCLCLLLGFLPSAFNAVAVRLKTLYNSLARTITVRCKNVA